MSCVVKRFVEEVCVQEKVELLSYRCVRCYSAVALVLALSASVAMNALKGPQRKFFEILTRRMDVDVDGAPNAYGPRNKPTLDDLISAHDLERADREIVGYLVDEKNRPILQQATVC